MNSTNKILSFSLTLLSVVLVIYGLVVAKALLIPFIIAVLFWHLINTISHSIKRIIYIGEYIPNSVCLVLAIAVFALLIWALGNIISNNVTAVINAAPRYQATLMQFSAKIDHAFDIKSMTKLSEYLKEINIQSALVNVYGVFTGITSNAVIIILYIIFLFFEQQVLQKKIDKIFQQKSHHTLALNIMSHIIKDTQTYLGIKTFTSLLTAVTSWIIMKKVGLDFAEFWAILIFFLNYIPNIGAIIATLFPAMLAVIQFQALTPFLIVTVGITSTQFVVGNLLEPRLMGRSLNLSPLIILISLAVWGSLWGVIGMFLSVPITVMMLIICSQFERTRGIAILLSQNGQLKDYKIEAQHVKNN